jgi:hypothetical protein
MSNEQTWLRAMRRSAAGLALFLAAACQSRPEGPGHVTPIYNKQTGRLEQLVGDQQGDGRVDMRGYMDGSHLSRIEIDRNRDGRPDRWEYYAQPAPGDGTTPRVQLVRAEEANGPDSRVTRREFYVKGVLDHVEEDTDGDGRIDKWEQYADGALVRMDLDLSGGGFPDHRLTYRPDGSLERTDVDTKGDGRFKTSEAAAASAAPTRGGGHE